MTESWGMRVREGQNCNNSCLPLRNTECSPAMWINKLLSLPPRPGPGLVPIVPLQVGHHRRHSPATCFQLAVMKQEITANLTFLAALMRCCIMLSEGQGHLIAIHTRFQGLGIINIFLSFAGLLLCIWSFSVENMMMVDCVWCVCWKVFASVYFFGRWLRVVKNIPRDSHWRVWRHADLSGNTIPLQ